MLLPRLRATLFLYALALISSLTPAYAQTVTRGPYLQRSYQTFTIIRWATSSSTDSVIKVGAAPGEETLSFTSGATGTDHRVEISGLQPATRYYYKIKSGTSTLAGGDNSHYFTTSPSDGDEPFNVWALGDSGISSQLPSGEHPDQAAVRDAFLNKVPLEDLAFLIHLGDIAYSEGTDSQFQKGFFDVYPTILRTLTTWPTQGNHDHTANAYYSVFSLPRSAEAGGVASGREEYYSWDHGNAHFVSLNSENSSSSFRSTMITWLNQDLAASTKTWTVVIFHHPPYTKGSHDSDNESDSGGRMKWMRESILPILENRGVDLVLTGHSHSYERSHFIDGHYGLSSTFTPAFKKSSGSGKEDLGEAYTKAALAPLANGGAGYIVAGSGGQLQTGVPLNHAAMHSSQAVLGSLHLSFNANQLDVRFITSTGTIGDYFTIIKDTARPSTPLAFSAGDSTPSCTIPLQWSASIGATSYSIYRSQVRHNRGALLASGITATSYADPAPTPDVTHYYSVRAINTNGAGPWSSLDSGILNLTDTDGDGSNDCVDGCPSDPASIAPGECGCGQNIDTDGDGTLDCNDSCPNDSTSTTPGVCGCGKNIDTDGDATLDCNDSCPNDPTSTTPGVCGCGNNIDTDGDATLDCKDTCPNDQKSTTPGMCGCGKSPIGEFANGTSNCSRELSNNLSPSPPRITGSTRRLRIFMDSYVTNVRRYEGEILSKGRLIKRISSEKSVTSVRLARSGNIKVRYRIVFGSSRARSDTKWSKATRYTVP